MTAGSDDGRVVQAYARVAGALLLLSMVAGGFGEGYVPSKLIVSSSAAATVQNLHAFESLYRMGFASYLVEAVCDVALALIFYVLLRPVGRNVALLTAFFGLLGTATFATSEMFYLAPVLLLGGSDALKAFSPDQLGTLALLSLKVYGYSGMTFTVFYGVAWVVRGTLMFRSGYLPKFLGVLMALGGLGFVARNFLLVLAPDHAPQWLLLLMVPGGLSLAVWLLVKGVDGKKWEAATTTH